MPVCCPSRLLIVFRSPILLNLLIYIVVLYFTHSLTFLSVFCLLFLLQSLTVAAPKIDAGAGPLRAKRKNAGMNRRYFGDDYVVDGVEEENITRKKRRKTSVTSDIDVEASAQLTAAAWMAKAPEGPVSSHLMAASDIYRTLGPLSRLAAVAVAIADGGDAMELD